MTDFKVKAKATKRRLLQNVSGTIMPMGAIAMIALAGMVGGGVDMSRAYMVQNKLQNACDSGVLAGRRSVGANGFNAPAKARADTFFETNFDESNEGVSNTSFVTSTPDDGNTVDGSASTTLDTVVMRLFGFDEIPLSVDCTASMSVGNSDVMMVLDVTGSMGWDLDGTQTRLAALKKAMNSFYDTVSASADGGNSRIRYGFVPYSSSVNVGKLILERDANFLADKMTIQSRRPIFEEVQVRTLDGYEPAVYSNDRDPQIVGHTNWSDLSGPYANNAICRNAKPANSRWTNSGGSNNYTVGPYINASGQRITEEVTRQRQSRTQYGCIRKGNKQHYVRSRTNYRDLNQKRTGTENPIYTTTTKTEFDRWRYSELEYQTDSLKKFQPVDARVGTNGTTVTSTWSGCIEERKTVKQDSFSFDSMLGITPSGALDLDIDNEPTSNFDSKWKPMWSSVAFERGNNQGAVDSRTELDPALSFCPAEAQTLQKMDKGQFGDYVKGLNATGATYHSIGMIWGARLASPQGIWESNVIDAPENGGDVARHLVFMSDGEMSTSHRIQTSYGLERYDQRVTDDGFSNNNARHTQRFLTACEVAKSKGIRVWVIAFATNLTGDLEQCASDDSAFTAASSSQLNEAFQEIAKDVGELRITQ